MCSFFLWATCSIISSFSNLIQNWLSGQTALFLCGSWAPSLNYAPSTFYPYPNSTDFLSLPLLNWTPAQDLPSHFKLRMVHIQKWPRPLWLPLNSTFTFFPLLAHISSYSEIKQTIVPCVRANPKGWKVNGASLELKVELSAAVHLGLSHRYSSNPLATHTALVSQ